jgi:hypothetical protein
MPKWAAREPGLDLGRLVGGIAAGLMRIGGDLKAGGEGDRVQLDMPPVDLGASLADTLGTRDRGKPILRAATINLARRHCGGRIVERHCL